MVKKSEETPPRRLRWSVPAADTSVLRWLDEQENVSHSLRLLIRESITRDGYVDVVNKPVEQQPRRGRPPAEVAEQDGTVSPEPPARSSAVEETAQTPQTPPAPSGEAPAASDTGRHASAAVAEDAEPEPQDERRPAPRQRSIDEIFSSTRK